MWDESELVTKLTETFMHLSQRLSGFLSEGQSKVMSARLFDQLQKLLEDSYLLEHFNDIKEKLSSLLETSDNSSVANQVSDLSQRLVNIFEESQRSVSPPLFDLQTRFFTTIEEFQKQLDVMVKYDWDFDHYLEEDIPAVMDYIRSQSKPKDDKLFAIGHSMGGILLYGMLSKYGYEGRDPRLAAVVTLASSLDYTTSKSTLKMLLPLANPAQVLNVPVVPLGAMLSAAYPFTSSPPYVLSWLNNLISAEDMMDPELLKKLVLNNFCTISAKLLLQLTTTLREGGLRDRSGTFFYKEHLPKITTPVLAFAGDHDLICPPEAVYETVKFIPENMVTYKVVGQPGGPHYAHYDLVGGRLAVEEIYPRIIEFLSCND
uniref:AB hydrolase-1 domain-containing protein n=1 Tax=Chenopodium quinoa TaxID=63459 RepID=A0A803LJH0_CHEQI